MNTTTIQTVSLDNDLFNAEDEYLLALAEERLKNDDGISFSLEKVMEHYGITQEDVDNAEEEEFE